MKDQYLKRLVRMHFKEENVDDFLRHFQEDKSKIRSFQGCKYLELLKDAENPSIFMTLSHWENEEALNAYRNSELFGLVWTRTKQWFKEKPIAYSLFTEVNVEDPKE